MKRMMLAGLVIAAMALPAMLKAQVETSAGKPSISGKVKWTWMDKVQDDQAVNAATGGSTGSPGQRWSLDGKGLDQFITSSAELDIKGTLGENVVYIIELQASWFPLGPGGGLAGVSGPGEIQSSRIGVRQAKIVITDFIPMTTVTLGTFNIPLGTYQTRATNDWGLIALPLMNLARFGNAPSPKSSGPGRRYAPIGLGWQATGVDICVKPADIVALHLAYFNGTTNGSPKFGPGPTVTGNTNADLDLEKSWLIKLEVNPIEGGQIGVVYLNEGWQEDLNAKGGNEPQHAQGWVINAAYRTDKIDFNADWMTMTASNYQHRAGAWKRFKDLNWMAWQITAGIWVTDQIEILARYDWIDPNTSNNKFRPAPAGPPYNYSYLARNDALTIWTLGANFRVSENAELALNYLWIKEQGLPINQRRADKASTWGDKFAAGADHGKRQQLANDTFLLQVQVWQ